MGYVFRNSLDILVCSGVVSTMLRSRTVWTLWCVQEHSGCYGVFSDVVVWSGMLWCVHGHSGTVCFLFCFQEQSEYSVAFKDRYNSVFRNILDIVACS